MPLTPWTILTENTICTNPVLYVDEVICAQKGHRRSTFTRIHLPDWVNVLPVTADGRVVLIRQYRHGIRQETLEIPGGVLEPDELPLEGARRELQEETGLTGSVWHDLGSLPPNPALQTNRCHFFLLLDAQYTSPTDFDPDEEILVEEIPLSQLPEIISSGGIQNAIVVAAVGLAWASGLLSR